MPKSNSINKLFIRCLTGDMNEIYDKGLTDIKFGEKYSGIPEEMRSINSTIPRIQYGHIL